MEQENSSANYSVEAGQWHDEPTYILRDLTSGAEATIVPGIGSNCVAWSVTAAGGKVEILETPPSAEELRSRRFKGGIPVLWPFPGRVRDARYEFNGTEYHLPRTDKGGVHHIHGLVIFAKWRVVESGADDQGVRLVTTIGPEDLSEEMRAGYPFDFALTLTYTLRNHQLILDTRVENKAKEQQMPFGYGLHPYFRAPLQVSEVTPGRTACLVNIPGSATWPTTEGLPNGPAKPVAPEVDFREWRKLGPLPFDHMYTDVSFENDWTMAGFRDDGEAGLEVQIRADHHFREWVLFTQPNRPSLCIEPYSCPPNSINFIEEGLADSGLVVLEPGQAWDARVIFEVKKFA